MFYPRGKGGGGGEGGGGGSVTSYIWHSADVRIAPFSALPSIWLVPFFQQKVYEWPDFSGFLCERPHLSDILVYAHIFRSEIFRDCLSSWYNMNWLWYLCNNQQIMGTKSKGQYMNRSTFWMIKYMKGPFFQRPGIWMGRFWNTGSHTRTKTTPKLPPPHPPPRFYQITKLTSDNIYWKSLCSNFTVIHFKHILGVFFQGFRRCCCFEESIDPSCISGDGIMIQILNRNIWKGRFRWFPKLSILNENTNVI